MHTPMLNRPWQLVDLQARTGVETIVVAVRCSTDDKLVPQVFTTSPQAEQLFQSLYGDSLEDFAQRLEGYIVSGAAVVLEKPKRTFTALKAHAADLLHELFVNEPTPRINYERFEATFTEVYGVVCEGWPLPVFKAPGNMTSKADVKKVIEAWEAGTGRFCRLSKSEMRRRDKGENIPGIQRAPGVVEPSPQAPTAAAPAASATPSIAEGLVPPTSHLSPPANAAQPPFPLDPALLPALPSVPLPPVPPIIPAHNTALLSQQVLASKTNLPTGIPPSSSAPPPSLPAGHIQAFELQSGGSFWLDTIPPLPHCGAAGHTQAQPHAGGPSWPASVPSPSPPGPTGSQVNQPEAGPSSQVTCKSTSKGGRKKRKPGEFIVYEGPAS
ncbi:hypothetical protein K474DRAFT_1704992 [Panus rudis PR-1116 ss-1]|nr:hypothetical protein K474DRAFT_1704992 [Panus rudis PR-1116 ss-1]